MQEKREEESSAVRCEQQRIAKERQRRAAREGRDAGGLAPQLEAGTPSTLNPKP